MTLEILSEAQAEARDAAHWYERASPGLGNAFLDELEQAYRAIEKDPRRFALIEYPRGLRGDVRRALLHRFPYVVIFQLHADRTVVLAIMHARRSADSWKHRMG